MGWSAAVYDERRRESRPISARKFEAVMGAISQGVRHGTLLIHCVAGIYRSPVMTAAWLHRCGYLNLVAALVEIDRRRPINPSPVLLRSVSLQMYPSIISLLSGPTRIQGTRMAPEPGREGSRMTTSVSLTNNTQIGWKTRAAMIATTLTGTRAACRTSWRGTTFLPMFLTIRSRHPMPSLPLESLAL